MKFLSKLCEVLLGAALFATLLYVVMPSTAGAVNPQVHGPVVIVGTVDGGTLPVSKIGGIVFDEQSQQLLFGDGGAWTPIGTSATSNFLFATLTAAQGTNIGGDDHIKFDVVTTSSGSFITLDTSTTYTKANAVASIGRFTLAGGHCYQLSYSVSEVVFSNSNSVAVFGWVEAETGTLVNPVGVAVAVTTGTSNQWSTFAQAIVCPAANTRYDVRLTSAPTNLSQVGNSGTTVDGGSQKSVPSAVIIALK